VTGSCRAPAKPEVATSAYGITHAQTNATSGRTITKTETETDLNLTGPEAETRSNADYDVLTSSATWPTAEFQMTSFVEDGNPAMTSSPGRNSSDATLTGNEYNVTEAEEFSVTPSVALKSVNSTDSSPKTGLNVCTNVTSLNGDGDPMTSFAALRKFPNAIGGSRPIGNNEHVTAESPATSSFSVEKNPVTSFDHRKSSEVSGMNEHVGCAAVESPMTSLTVGGYPVTSFGNDRHNSPLVGSNERVAGESSVTSSANPVTSYRDPVCSPITVEHRHVDQSTRINRLETLNDVTKLGSTEEDGNEPVNLFRTRIPAVREVATEVGVAEQSGASATDYSMALLYDSRPDASSRNARDVANTVDKQKSRRENAARTTTQDRSLVSEPEIDEVTREINSGTEIDNTSIHEQPIIDTEATSVIPETMATEGAPLLSAASVWRNESDEEEEYDDDLWQTRWNGRRTYRAPEGRPRWAEPLDLVLPVIGSRDVTSDDLSIRDSVSAECWTADTEQPSFADGGADSPIHRIHPHSRTDDYERAIANGTVDCRSYPLTEECQAAAIIVQNITIPRIDVGTPHTDNTDDSITPRPYTPLSPADGGEARFRQEDRKLRSAYTYVKRIESQVHSGSGGIPSKHRQTNSGSGGDSSYNPGQRLIGNGVGSTRRVSLRDAAMSRKSPGDKATAVRDRTSSTRSPTEMNRKICRSASRSCDRQNLMTSSATAVLLSSPRPRSVHSIRSSASSGADRRLMSSKPGPEPLRRLLMNRSRVSSPLQSLALYLLNY